MGNAITVKSVIIILSLVFAQQARASAPNNIKTCGESWPPYYYENTGKDNGAQSQVIGINIAMFEAISEITGLSFSHKIIPWNRCLYNTENFNDVQIEEIAMDATFSSKRAEKYHYVGPIYNASNALFYSVEAFPNGVINPESGKLVTKYQELKHFSICGIAGWNYDIYTDKYGIPKENIVTSTQGGSNQVMKMLDIKRCQVFEAQTPIIAGGIATNEIQLPPTIRCQPLNEKPVNFYMMLSKQSPRASSLHVALTQALVELREKGKYQEILTDYFAKLLSEKQSRIMDCM